MFNNFGLKKLVRKIGEKKLVYVRVCVSHECHMYECVRVYTRVSVCHMCVRKFYKVLLKKFQSII